MNTAMLDALQKAYDAMPKMPAPAMYVMNWHTWVKARRVLKARGIPVVYRPGLGRKRYRYVNGVPVYLFEGIEGDEILQIEQPKWKLSLRLPLEPYKPPFSEIFWPHFSWRIR